MNWTARGEDRLELVLAVLTGRPQDAHQVAEGARLRGLSITCHGVVFFRHQLERRGLASRRASEPATTWVRRDQP